MAGLLEVIRVWLEQLILGLGYSGIAIAMFVENLFPPIPSEAIMLFTGFLVQQGRLALIGVLLAGTVGSVLGTGLIYFIGVWSDELVVRRFLRRYGHYLLVSEENLDESLRFFQRHGGKMVFFGRMIPIVRTLISLPAGLNHMPAGRFFLLTSLGTLIWNSILVGAGMLLGQNWGRMLAFTDRYERLVLVAAVGLVLFVIGKHLLRRRTVPVS